MAILRGFIILRVTCNCM